MHAYYTGVKKIHTAFDFNGPPKLGYCFALTIVCGSISVALIAFTLAVVPIDQPSTESVSREALLENQEAPYQKMHGGYQLPYMSTPMNQQQMPQPMQGGYQQPFMHSHHHQQMEQPMQGGYPGYQQPSMNPQYPQVSPAR